MIDLKRSYRETSYIHYHGNGKWTIEEKKPQNTPEFWDQYNRFVPVTDRLKLLCKTYSPYSEDTPHSSEIKELQKSTKELGNFPLSKQVVNDKTIVTKFVDNDIVREEYKKYQKIPQQHTSVKEKRRKVVKNKKERLKTDYTSLAHKFEIEIPLTQMSLVLDEMVEKNDGSFYLGCDQRRRHIIKNKEIESEKQYTNICFENGEFKVTSTKNFKEAMNLKKFYNTTRDSFLRAFVKWVPKTNQLKYIDKVESRLQGIHGLWLESEEPKSCERPNREPSTTYVEYIPEEEEMNNNLVDQNTNPLLGNLNTHGSHTTIHQQNDQTLIQGLQTVTDQHRRRPSRWCNKNCVIL